MLGLPRPVRLERAFDDPAAIRRLVERSGPFASIASYLPPAATGVRGDGDALGDPPGRAGGWLATLGELARVNDLDASDSKMSFSRCFSSSVAGLLAGSCAANAASGSVAVLN